MPAPQANQIHVLIVLSPIESASSEEGEFSEEEQLPVVRTSQLNVSTANSLVEQLGITIQSVASFDTNASTIPGFQWNNHPLEEAYERTRYRLYVEDSLRKELKAQNLWLTPLDKVFSVVVPGYDIELIGSADLIILPSYADLSYRDSLRKVKMEIKVKHTIAECQQLQTMTELIAMDLLATDPIMAVLTDLNQQWYFHWVSGDTGVPTITGALVKNPTDAFEMIQQAISCSKVDFQEQFACIEPAVNRRKLTHKLLDLKWPGESEYFRSAFNAIWTLRVN